MLPWREKFPLEKTCPSRTISPKGKNEFALLVEEAIHTIHHHANVKALSCRKKKLICQIHQQSSCHKFALVKHNSLKSLASQNRRRLDVKKKSMHTLFIFTHSQALLVVNNPVRALTVRLGTETFQSAFQCSRWTSSQDRK